MPYKFEYKHIKLTETQDRRVKLTADQKEEIKSLYKPNVVSYNTLAKQFNVSKRLIMFICNPAMLERSNALHKERRKDKRYYNTNKNTIAMKDHRQYKKLIIKEI